MHEEQRQRAAEALKKDTIDCALFANNDSVKWLTGFARPVELDLHLFAGGPPCVWYDGESWTLIIPDVYQNDITLAPMLATFSAEPNCRVQTYETYTIAHPIRSEENFPDAIYHLTEEVRGRVGVEYMHITGDVLQTLDETLDGQRPDRIDGMLTPLRMVKTGEEIEKIRYNYLLADIAHAAARGAVRAGAREIDVFAAAQQAVNTFAGRRVPMGNDFVANTRQNNIGGWGLDRALDAHGSIMMDLATVDAGYWSDTCAAYYVDPTERRQKMWRLAIEALEYAIGLVKPGVRANEIDQQVRAFVERAGFPVYPHHTGHGVGVSGHEEPRIVPYNTILLEPGMVIALEPGTYIPGEDAARAEVGLLVTDDGAEILSHHLDDWLFRDGRR